MRFPGSEFHRQLVQLVKQAPGGSDVVWSIRQIPKEVFVRSYSPDLRRQTRDDPELAIYQ